MWNGAGSMPACISPRRPCGIEEHQAVEEFDFVRGADAAIKVVEVGAAAERYVLAIVNVLAVGQHVRSGAAAEEGALLK